MFYMPRPCDIQPGPLAWNSSPTFLVQESHEMRPRENVNRVGIYGGCHCHGAKYSTSPSRESKPGAGSTGD